MLVFGTQPETLPVSVERDASTQLPLLSQADAILQYLLAHLALPYSVAEHGCGKKTSLILDRLVELRLPPYALWRGLILERDMSPAAMAAAEITRRPHALICENPLARMADLSNPGVRRMLDEACPDVRIVGREIRAGSFTLHHESKVQFVIARSHVYPIVWFWDPEAGAAVERVIDLTLVRDGLFEVEKVRQLLAAPEGLLFAAPMLGHFRLDAQRLTAQQREAVARLLPAGAALESLTPDAHAALVRRMTGAAHGSMGDPGAWTYANNMWGGETEHDADQRRRTGRGDAYDALFTRLLRGRQAHRHDLHEVRAELGRLTEEIGVRRILRADAQWSAKQLEPLADVAMTLVYYKALGSLARGLQRGEPVLDYLQTAAALSELRGIGVRMRRRIDKLALASEAAGEQIDARALSEPFVRTVLETVRQMNAAGLAVCVDRVGNLHGLRLEQTERERLGDRKTSIAALLAHSVVFGSHIDSVKDAGKFDGRLGVTAGLEVAHVLRDLDEYFGVAIERSGAPRIVVSAYIGEEMTFTGGGISMPGSAAVAGLARVSVVHQMKNGAGDRFLDGLVEMLRVLRREQLGGTISLVNDFHARDVAALLEACFDPTEFYTPHSYERHIEQGPILDRAGVPMALVDTIMGIHQEDFFFRGDAAEAAALELNQRMRSLTHETRYRDVRITVGILEAEGERVVHDSASVALRWTLLGEKNHAGATETRDRRDPGVAAARLAAAFRSWLAAHPELESQGVVPIVGNVQMIPGTNRNVIPGQVSMTLALLGERLSPLQVEDLDRTLRGYAIGTLAKSVPLGGEGMYSCRAEPISYVTVARKARLTIDLRADSEGIIEAFRAELEGVLEDLRASYGVTIGCEVQQRLSPMPLARSGQVLLMERSYGGSHNPNETELLVDITRGCVLQLAVTAGLLMNGDRGSSLNLFDEVERCMPRLWLDKLPRYTSGALHDTSNIAARAATVGGESPSTR